MTMMPLVERIWCTINQHDHSDWRHSYRLSGMRSTPDELSAIPSWRISDPVDISTVPRSSNSTVGSSWSSLSCSLGSTSTSSLSVEWDGSSVATQLARLSISPTNHTAVTNVYENLDVDCGLMHGLRTTTACRSPGRRMSVELPTGSTEPISRKPTHQKSLTKWTELDNELEVWERHLSEVGSGGRRISQSQLAGLSNFVRRLRVAVRHKNEEGIDLCAFCRNNGEPFEIYVTHKVKDSTGRVTCPVLRLLSCPLCKSTGDVAHTIKYCPYRFMEQC
ncbi:Nanos 1 [Clonorchis sinensis]|uniref:Nanos 1 n=1 Tax=Clonorchis sinensis TaxID=79923 RepID=A0A3R7G8D3_CLOSI|nr:Nanos 1 [Clonorchis sinensis]